MHVHRIHWILTSLDGLMKISYNRCLYVEVHYVLIKHENGKAKPTHDLVQIIDLDEPNDQRREWFLERQELVSDPTLAKDIGIYNIYHQMWVLIEQERTLMHCGKTISPYHNEFGKYMNVEGATSEDLFDSL